MALQADQYALIIDRDKLAIRRGESHVCFQLIDCGMSIPHITRNLEIIVESRH